MLHTPTSALTILPLEDALCLDQTLHCGQAFRWREISPGVHRGVAGDRAVSVWVQQSYLYVSGDDAPDAEAFWRNYFDLNTDYTAIKTTLSAHPPLKAAVDYAPGIRLLRQGAFEALISFIISQNNHIGRIGAIIERLCERWGEDLGGGAYSFPTPERLAALSLPDLAPLQAGYRDKYLLDAAVRVASGALDLTEVAALPLAEARAALMEIKGVGIKVADCALLYGFYRAEVCPMDVWMKRAMAALLPEGWPESVRPIAGIAQQYLFHYARTCPEALSGG
jgi:N-glycosylase/DNA lyase